ncbi:MAG: hypothetical protein KF744_08985 [Taibaiella sp.]|nr:hypothetical protein [Taibaiella sp.]
MPLSAQITAVIPEQRFELCRDRIAEVLYVELNNQYQLRVAAWPTDPTKWHPEWRPAAVEVERFMPPDESEFPVVVVSCAKGSISNKDYGGERVGTYQYYVDVYTGAASQQGSEGDTLAALSLERLLAMISAILDNPLYATLGFEPAGDVRILRVNVIDFFVNPQKKTMNAVDYICGSLLFQVEVWEVVPLLDTVAVEAIHTVVEIGEDTGKTVEYDVPGQTTA